MKSEKIKLIENKLRNSSGVAETKKILTDEELVTLI